MRDRHGHTRINDSLTGPIERPVLQWLVAHLPARTSPALLTVLGAMGALATGAAYCLTNLSDWFLWLANLGLVVNWFGDSLDGTLARHRHIERPLYGFYVDHTTDAFSQTAVLLGFGLSPYVRFELACLLLIGLLLASVVAYIRAFLEGVFKITVSRIGPTEARLLLLIANLVVLFAGNPPIRLHDVDTNAVELSLAVATLVLFVLLVISFQANLARFRRLDR